RNRSRPDSSLGRNRSGHNVCSRERQSDHLAAVSAERQVLEHAIALGRRKRLLGKSRQQISIRMRSLGPGSLRQSSVRQSTLRSSSPQSVIHDLRYFSHGFPCLRLVPEPFPQGTFSPRNLALNASANSTLCPAHRFPALP